MKTRISLDGKRAKRLARKILVSNEDMDKFTQCQSNRFSEIQTKITQPVRVLCTDACYERRTG